MTDVEQLTCEELEAELDHWIRVQRFMPFGLNAYHRSMDVLKELKSRRLAQSAG